MDKKQFALRLARIIADRGIAESKMSEDLNFHRTYIHNITSGRSLPKMEPFFQICNYLDITPAEFFNTPEEEKEKLSLVTKSFLELPPDVKLALLDVIRKLK